MGTLMMMLVITGVAGQKPAEQDANAQQRARILGRRLVQVCAATRDIRVRPTTVSEGSL